MRDIVGANAPEYGAETLCAEPVAFFVRTVISHPQALAGSLFRTVFWRLECSKIVCSPCYIRATWQFVITLRHKVLSRNPSGTEVSYSSLRARSGAFDGPSYEHEHRGVC